MQPTVDKLQAQIGGEPYKNRYNFLTKQRRTTMYLAEKIVKLRKEKGWSQEELADKVNVSRQAVS